MSECHGTESWQPDQGEDRLERLGREWWIRCDFLWASLILFPTSLFLHFLKVFTGVLGGQLTIESFCIQGIPNTRSKSGVMDFRWQRIGNAIITGSLLDSAGLSGSILPPCSLSSLPSFWHFHILFLFPVEHFNLNRLPVSSRDYAATSGPLWQTDTLTERIQTLTAHLSDLLCMSQINDL